MSTKIHDLAECGFFASLGTQSSTAVTTATVVTTGATKDFITGDGQCTLLVATGTLAGTSPTCGVSVQESTDGTTWTGIGGTFVGGTFNLQAVSSLATTAVGFERTKRYLQTIQTTSGTSAVCPFAAVIIEQKKVLN